MIDPIILRIGFIQIGYYTLVYLLGFLTVLIVLLRCQKEVGLKENEVYSVVLVLITGVLIGARAFYILFWDLNCFLSNFSEIVRIWEGGLSFHGGLLGGCMAVWFYSRKKDINLWKMFDVIILPAVLFLALGRIANFINQEIVGKTTDFIWCVKFNSREGCKHPVQLYSATGRLVLFGVLFWIQKKVKRLKPGFLFWSFIFLTGTGRFLLDFIREDAIYLGLATGQWLSLILTVIGGQILHKKYWNNIKNLKKCL